MVKKKVVYEWFCTTLLFLLGKIIATPREITVLHTHTSIFFLVFNKQDNFKIK